MFAIQDRAIPTCYFIEAQAGVRHLADPVIDFVGKGERARTCIEIYGYVLTSTPMHGFRGMNMDILRRVMA